MKKKEIAQCKFSKEKKGGKKGLKKTLKNRLRIYFSFHNLAAIAS